jgi:hypothetical protein
MKFFTIAALLAVTTEARGGGAARHHSHEDDDKEITLYENDTFHRNWKGNDQTTLALYVFGCYALVSVIAFGRFIKHTCDSLDAIDAQARVVPLMR